MNYTDRSLTCAQCGTDFTFTADDQEFHASRGYQDPKRCPSCRAQRRAQNNSGGYSNSGYSSSGQSNGGYSNSGYPNGGNSNGGYSNGGYSDRPRREMFTTTCSRCGREAQVPFVPRNDRPVYCSDCYQPAPRRW